MTTQTLNSYTKQQNTINGHPGFLHIVAKAWQHTMQRRQHRKAYFQLLSKPSFLLRDIGVTHQQINREIDRTSLLRWK